MSSNTRTISAQVFTTSTAHAYRLKLKFEHLLRKAIEVVPVERLWVNPDCGLKTRGWKETLEQLQVMMNVTHKLRAELAK